MIGNTTTNDCSSTTAEGGTTAAEPADPGDHYLARESELARRSSVFAEMIRLGALIDGLWFWDLVDREHCYFSPGFWRVLGFDPGDKAHKMHEWTDLLYDEDVIRFHEALDAHLRDTTQSFNVVVRCRTADGATLRLRTRGVALVEDGVPSRMSGTHDVLSDTREDELSEKMAELLERSSDAISVWSPIHGVRRWNDGARRMFGCTAEEMIGRIPHETFGADFSEPVDDIIEAIEEGESWAGDITWRHRDGSVVHTSSHLQRIAAHGDDTLILQVDHDVTAKVELRQRQRAMTRELNHRVKNLFAVIRSLVKLSAMDKTEVPPLVRDLDQRITALAAAHVVSLGYEMQDGGPVGEILEAVLTPYPADRAALRLDGAELWLPQSKITPMGLILNELATNALKYGAWKTGDGYVSIRWSAVTDDGVPVVRLVWDEHSPHFAPVAPGAVRRGFGTDLIDMSTAQMGAILTRGDGPDGIRLSLSFEAAQQSTQGGPVSASARRPGASRHERRNLHHSKAVQAHV